MNQELLSNLVTAVSNGRTDIVRTLLSAASEQLNDSTGNKEGLAAVLNEPVNEHGTLLHLATKLDYTDIVRTLLSAGARPNVENFNGDTPLDLVASETMSLVYGDELLKAAAISDTRKMKELLESGVSVNTQDCPMSGNNPLHWAASYGNLEAVKFLIDNNVDVNATNSLGLTPLHDAVQRGDASIVEILLTAGADPNIKATKGKFASLTPLDLASKHENIHQLFAKYAVQAQADGSSDSQENSSHKRHPSLDSISAVSQDSMNFLNAQVANLSFESSWKECDAPCCKPQTLRNTTVQNGSVFTSSTALRIVSDSRLHLLWPQPQKIIQTSGCSVSLPNDLTIAIIQQFHCGNDILNLWQLHASAFKDLGYEVLVQGIFPLHTQTGCSIVCSVNPFMFSSSDSYKIHVTTDSVVLTGSSICGLHYAVCTLLQLLHVCGEDPLPPILIEDWPTLMNRGIMLDFSSDSCVPTLDTLKCLITMLGSLKINQLHIYLRFSATDCWQLPYSNRELVDVLHFCSERFISVVPAIDIEPFLASTDLPIVGRAIDKFLACFSNAKLIHIGPHLTNYGSSNQPLFSQLLQMLPQLNTSGAFLVCANNFTDSFTKFPTAPSNVILVDYGHQVNHDFAGNCKLATERGCTTWVCPGTSAWNSLAGCPEVCVKTLWQASNVALEYHLNGLIIADWAGSPPFVPLCFSWPGLLLGSGLAWNPHVHLDFLQSKVSSLIDLHLAKDKEGIIGSALVGLGDIETFLQRAACNQAAGDVENLFDSKGSLLQQLFTKPDEVNLENLTDDTFQTAIRHIKHSQIMLPKTKASCPQSAELVMELKLTTDWMIFACRLGRHLVSTGRNPSSTTGLAVINVGIANLPATVRTDMANKLLCMIEKYRSVWWCRHLPSGLQSSLLLFNTLFQCLLPEGSETNSPT